MSVSLVTTTDASVVPPNSDASIVGNNVSNENIIENPLHHLLTTPSWTIDTDEFLLDFLHDFANRYTESLSQVQTQVDQLMNALDTQEVMMQNVMNEFDILKITQFMEHRIYDDNTAMNPSDVEALKSDTKDEMNEDELKIKKHEEIMKKYILALKYGDEALERYSIFKDGNADIMNDDDDDIDPFAPEGEASAAAVSEKRAAEMARIHGLIRPRKLPYLIGSKEFIEDEMCGLEPEEDPGIVSPDTLLSKKKNDLEPVPESDGYIVPVENSTVDSKMESQDVSPSEKQIEQVSQSKTTSVEFTKPEIIHDAPFPESSKNYFEEEDSAAGITNTTTTNETQKTGDLFNTQYFVDDDVFDLDELENQFTLTKNEKTEAATTSTMKPTTNSSAKPSFSFFDDYDVEDDLDDILNIETKPKVTTAVKESVQTEVTEVIETTVESQPTTEAPKASAPNLDTLEDDEFGSPLPAYPPTEGMEAKPAEVMKPASVSNFFGPDLLDDDDDNFITLTTATKTQTQTQIETKPTSITATKGLLDDLEFDVDDFSLPVQPIIQPKPKPSFGAATSNLFSGSNEDFKPDVKSKLATAVSHPIEESEVSDKKIKVSTPVTEAQSSAFGKKPVTSIDDLLAMDTSSNPPKKDIAPKPEPKKLAAGFESAIMKGLMSGPPPMRKPTSSSVSDSNATKTFDGGVSTRDKIEHLNLNKPRRAKGRRPTRSTGIDLSSLPADDNDLFANLDASKPKSANRKPIAKKSVEKKIVEKKPTRIVEKPVEKIEEKKPTRNVEKKSIRKSTKLNDLGDMFDSSTSKRRKPKKSAVDDEIFGGAVPVVVKKQKNEVKSKAAQLLKDDFFSDLEETKPTKPVTKAPPKQSTAKKTEVDDFFGELNAKKTRKSNESKKRASKKVDDLDDIFGSATKTKRTKKG